MNIKLSFAKKDMINFDYALTLKRKLGYKMQAFYHMLKLSFLPFSQNWVISFSLNCIGGKTYKTNLSAQIWTK